MRKTQISAIGYNKDCTEAAEKMAYEVGKQIARAGAILICGGLGGDGVGLQRRKREWRHTVRIIPQEEFSYANQFCDIVVCTGIGHARDFVVTSSSDGIIVVGGGIGTLIEMGVGYMTKKILVAMAGSGGTADTYGGKFLDERKSVPVAIAEDARVAVDLIVSARKN